MYIGLRSILSAQMIYSFLTDLALVYSIPFFLYALSNLLVRAIPRVRSASFASKYHLSMGFALFR
jgi:hypothetical protein